MRKNLPSHKFNIAIIILITLLLLFGAYCLSGYLLTSSGKSFPNVYAENTNIGNMTKDEIITALDKAGWSKYESSDLEVTSYCDKSISVNPVSAGVLSTAGSVADAALRYGKTDGILKAPINYIRCLNEKTDMNKLSTSLNEDYINSKIDELQSDIDSRTSSWAINAKTSELVIVKGYENSLQLDKDLLRNNITSALESHSSSLEFKTLSGALPKPDFSKLHDLVCCEALPAEFSTDGTHEIIEDKPGYDFDVSAAEKLWEEADIGDEIRIPLSVTYSDVTAEVLQSNMFIHLLGAMTTKYNNSDENRSSNVRLATSLVNGTVIFPGEEFSFNDTVGKRTEEAGFLMAPAYAGYDDIQEEIGGGVCQVSTGIYASALFAFLEVTSHTCHVYPPNYIQLGTDATVSIPDSGREIDLKIKNTKSYPIKIIGYCEEGENPDTGKPQKTVTIEIWGTLEDDDYMPVEFDNAWGDVYDYDRVIEPAIEGREGYRIQFTHDETEFEDDTGKGLRTLTYRRVYNSSGELVEKKILNPMYSFGYGMDTYYYKS